MGYIGNNSTLTGTQNQKQVTITATADQTDFTIAGGYGVGAIDVYRNGVKLSSGNDFTATNGSTVTLTQGASADDTLEFQVFENFLVTDAVTSSGDQSFNGTVTATAFSGPLTGDVTGNITGTAATFSGNVTVGGTLTYDDVTNIDSVGLITARNGLQVLAGITTISGQTNLTNTNVTAGILSATGQTNLANVNVSAALTATLTGNVTGIATGATEAADAFGIKGTPNSILGFSTVSGFDSNTIMWEKVNVVANKLSAAPNINLDSGMVHYFTTAETTTSTPNIQSTVGLNTQMSDGDALTCTIVTTAAAAGYSTGILIDGVATSPNWNGGSDPSAGGSSGLDVYTFNIIKTGSATYTVLGNVSNFA